MIIPSLLLFFRHYDQSVLTSIVHTCHDSVYHVVPELNAHLRAVCRADDPNTKSVSSFFSWNLISRVSLCKARKMSRIPANLIRLSRVYVFEPPSGARPLHGHFQKIWLYLGSATFLETA